MKYIDLLKKLYHINFNQGCKFGLSNMLELSKLCHHPQNQFQSIHIAGTNGKGSVSTKIAYALQKEGYKTGLFTSPHISSFRERIQIDQKLIDEDEVMRHLKTLFSSPINATFFELTTMLAFLHFAENKVDYAVIETGMGGKLDATNIIVPKLSVITSISLEHKEVLGDTIEKIAREKEGIIKYPHPVVIGPRVPIPKTKSPITQVQGHFKTYDEENSQIAKKTLEALQISNSSIEHGIKQKPPCRFEKIKVRFILDVAHNPDGVRALIQTLEQEYPGKKVHFVIGFSKNKEIKECLEQLIPKAKSFYLTKGDNVRGIEPIELRAYLNALHFSPSLIFLGDLEQASKNDGIIVVTGTFYIMKEARKFLGVNEPRDPIDLN